MVWGGGIAGAVLARERIGGYLEEEVRGSRGRLGWQQNQTVRQTEWAEGETEDEQAVRMGGSGSLPPSVLPPSLQFMQERTEEAKSRESVSPLGESVLTGEASAGEPAPLTPTVD